MTEQEFLIYCQSQVSGALTEDDIVLMLTAWGQIKHASGYQQALDEHGFEKPAESAADEDA